MINETAGQWSAIPATRFYVGVDIDGVIANSLPVYLRLFEELHGVRHHADAVTEYVFERCLPVTEQQSKDMLTLFHDSACLEAELMPGAREGLALLRTMGEVNLISSRQSDCFARTVSYLEKQGIGYDRLICQSGCKRTLCRDQSIDLDLLIEDKGETAARFALDGVPVLLFDYPYNRQYAVPGLHRVSGWAEAIAWIRQRFQGAEAKGVA